MIEVKNLKKSFITKDKKIDAVNDVSFTVEKKDIFGIVGFSGAGKSTLIRCLNLLEEYDSGSVLIENKELKSLSRSELLKKRESIGMIFQHFHLLQSATVYQNIASPLKNTKGYPKEKIKTRVMELLKLVDLEDKAFAYPSQLSGGQKQRVAIARALTRNCDILLCDEATSALDPNTTQSILQLLKKINKELGVTIVLITHQMEVVKEICNKIAVMENGKIVECNDLLSVFSNPQHPTTKQFIEQVLYPTELNEIIQNHQNPIYHFGYVGEIVDEAVLSHIQKQYDVYINILFGNIEWISGKKVGNMIVECYGSQLNEALQLLQQKNIKVRALS